MEDVVVLLPGDVAEGTMRTEDKSVWDRAHVLMLIKEYRNLESHFKDHTIKRKILWRKISQKLRKNGVNVSWELCDKKWRNLKQTFKTIYSSKRSEESKRRWEYYSELEDIFSSDPNVKVTEDTFDERPDDSVEVVEMSDIDTYLCNETEGGEADSSNEHCIYTKISTGDKIDNSKARVELSTNALRNEHEAPLWFQEFIKCFREDERVRTTMIQKMLEDVVKLEERKCEMLELLAEKLSESSVF